MKRKIIIPVICAIVLCGIVAGAILFGIGGKPRLSLLSEEKLLAVLSDYGVTVPEAFKEADIRGMVKRFEKDPDTPEVVSWTLYSDFSEQVRIAVKRYYASLAEFKEDEIMQMLADRGISIPEGFEWEDIRNLIAHFEEYPDAPGAYSNPVALEFSEKLQELVKEYYGIK